MSLARREGRLGAVAAALGVAALASPGTSHAEQPTLELRVAWVNVASTRRGVIAHALEHARSLLEPAGVALVTSEYPAAAELPVDVALLVFRPGEMRRSERSMLGNASPSTTAAWVYPDGVARVLGLDPARQHAWGVRDQLRWRRAIGVVVAHELLHSVARVEHAPRGMMRASLQCADLESDAKVDPSVLARLRAAVGAGVWRESTASLGEHERVDRGP
jgi:hypothetical protein